MLAGVVGAEEQLAAALELDTQVGLGTAAVASIGRREGGFGASAVVTSASFLSIGVWPNVPVGEKIPPLLVTSYPTTDLITPLSDSSTLENSVAETVASWLTLEQGSLERLQACLVRSTVCRG